MYHIVNGNSAFIPLASRSVQCAVTSPPYMGQRDYEVEGQIGQEISATQYISNIAAVFDEVWRVLRDDGVLWLNIADSYASRTKGSGGNTAKQKSNAGSYYASRKYELDVDEGSLNSIPWRVALALQGFAAVPLDDIYRLCQSIEKRDLPALDAFRAGFELWNVLARRGWTLRSDVIWDKINPYPESVKNRPSKGHEYVFMLVKSSNYYYNWEAVALPMTKTAKERFKRARNPNKYSDGIPGQEKQTLDAPRPHDKERVPDELRNRRTVWHLSHGGGYKGKHFATMPLRLAEICILATSRPGDIVFDPFAGVGTTGIAASKHGRHFVGVELNYSYIQEAYKRFYGTQIGLGDSFFNFSDIISEQNEIALD